MIAHKRRWLPGANCHQYRQSGIEARDGFVFVIDLHPTTRRTFGDPLRFDNLTDALRWADCIDARIMSSLFGTPCPEWPDDIEPL